MTLARLPVATRSSGQSRLRLTVGRDGDEPPSLSAADMGCALATVVIAASLVAGSFFWLGRSNAGESEIAENPVVAPVQSRQSPNALRPTPPPKIDASRSAEQMRQAPALPSADAAALSSRPAQQSNAEARMARPAPSSPALQPSPPAAAAAVGTLVQLGAFSSRARAERAKAELSARFPAVGAMPMTIVPFASGIRLRAAAPSPAQAKALCSALARAGQGCFVVR